MKKICLLASVVLCFATPRLYALTSPELVMGYLRTTVSNALYAVTNNNSSPDKKAVTALNRSLATIDRTSTTNVVSDTKTLSTLATLISHSSVSNMLGDDLADTIGYFYNWELGHANNSSNELNSAFPSGPKTAAGRNLLQVYRYFDSDSSNLPQWAKAVANASKKLVVVDKLVDKALSVPPPPAQFTATISAPAPGGTKFSAKPAPAVAVLSPATHLLTITGIQLQMSGRPPNATVTTRTLVLNIPNITSDGNFTYNVTDLGSDANVLYTVSVGSLGGTPEGDAYVATSGTVNVTVNTTAKTAVGTFSFSGPEQDDSSKTASSNNGVFSVIWQ